MSQPDRCDNILLVQAEFDGELDAAEAAALAVHRAGCPICQATTAELTRARDLIGDELRFAMPDDARDRLLARLDVAQIQRDHRAPTSRRRAGISLWQRWWPSGAGFGIGAACAAAVALFLVMPQEAGLVGQVVDSHIRALQPGHLEDVPSTDQHTVKPWFDGRVDFAPPVRELAAKDFPLQGGRLDYVNGRAAAVLVYRRAKHLIDLYIWPTASEPALAPASAQRQGYNIVHWRDGGMSFWAVSDLEMAQLRDFAEDFRQMP
jgi:anti-sigma factor RsiW